VIAYLDGVNVSFAQLQLAEHRRRPSSTHAAAGLGIAPSAAVGN
jgi:hypothetical protein